MSGIEEAAEAFRTELTTEQPSHRPSERERDAARAAPVELLGHGGVLENPDEEAGGDSMPIEGADDQQEAPKPRKQREERPQAEADDNFDPFDMEKILYGDEEGDGKAGEGDQEGDEEEGDGEEGDGTVLSSFLDAKHKVTVDGEEVEVTGKEALEGYIRTDTFHKRLNKVNEASQIVLREAEKVQASRDQYSGLLESLQQQLKAMKPEEPDWDAEFKRNPAQAREMQKRWENYSKQLAAVETEQKRVKAEAEQEEARLTGQYAREGFNKMMKDHSEWNDPKIRGKDLSSMHRTAAEVGFSNDEIDTVYDPRMLEILLRASKYDRMMAAQKRVKEARQKPGASRQRSNGSGSVPRVSAGPGAKESRRSSERLARTGSVHDAIPVFDQIIRGR